MRRYRWALAGATVLATLAVTAVVAAPAQAAVVTTFRNLNSGKCLGVLGGNMTNATPIVQWTCNGNPDQTWVIQSLDGGWTQIRNSVNQNKCLGVYASGTSDGSNLVIWDCDGSANQNWWFNGDMEVEDLNGTITHWFNGCYSIINYNASSPPGTTWINEPDDFFPRVIGVWGGQTGDGIQTVVWHATGARDQFWC